MQLKLTEEIAARGSVDTDTVRKSLEDQPEELGESKLTTYRRKMGSPRGSDITKTSNWWNFCKGFTVLRAQG